MNHESVLVCTVGTGDISRIEETLFEPLTKSIRRGQWNKVVLLPSQATLNHAEELRSRLGDVVIEVKPLLNAKDEDDPDSCFAHFDRILSEILGAGFASDSLVADFTRGTKAMSAALVLAAIRHDVPVVRYVAGEKRDERGMVVPGSETIVEVKTIIASARRLLDEAMMFFRVGNFGAAFDLLPSETQLTDLRWPSELATQAILARNLAAFYAAWDRLDYKRATEIELVSHVPSSTWHKFVPPAEVREWVADSAKPFPEQNHHRAIRLRSLVVDLFANGERRLRDCQYEDAVIRAYRVLELVGQIRLFDHDLDSDALPGEHPVVKAFQDELRADKRQEPLTEKNGLLKAPREKVARLLKRLGDPLAKRLLQLGNQSEGEVKLSKRNYSVWIHGFEAVAGSDPEPIRRLYFELEKLLIEDGGNIVQTRLKLARWLDFSRRD